MLLPGHAPDLLARLHGHRRAPDPAARPPRHRRRARRPQAARRATASSCVGSGTVDMKGGVVLSLGALRALAAPPERLRRGRAAAGLRRGVADGAVRARRALRRLGRVPVLRGRRAHARGRRGRRRAAQGGRARSRSPRTAAPRTRARRPTAAATRCSRSPRAAQAVAARHDPDGPARLTAVPTVLHSRRRVQRRPRPRASSSATCAPTTLDAIEAVLDAIPAERRRRAAGAGADPALARHGLRGRRPAGCSSAPRAALGRPSSGAPAAARATRATSPRRSRSPSTGSARAAARRTTRTSSCSRRRCASRAEVALAMIAAALAD